MNFVCQALKEGFVESVQVRHMEEEPARLTYWAQVLFNGGGRALTLRFEHSNQGIYALVGFNTCLNSQQQFEVQGGSQVAGSEGPSRKSILAVIEERIEFFNSLNLREGVQRPSLFQLIGVVYI